MIKCIIIFLGIVCVTYAENVNTSVDNLRLGENEENGGIQLCGARKESHHMHPIMNAPEQMFPYVVSCLSSNNEHLCTGTIISDGMVLTAASCIAKNINAVLAHTTKADVTHPGAVRFPVIKTEKFPGDKGEEALYNVGIVYTWGHKAKIATEIKISSSIAAQRLIDMELVGYGLNEPGRVRSLQYIGVERRYQDHPSTTSLRVYIDCVETKQPTCFTDYGGPALYGNELVGIVVSGSESCIAEMTANYAINKEIAVILPIYSFKDWLDEKVKAYEENAFESVTMHLQKLVSGPPPPAPADDAPAAPAGKPAHGYLVTANFTLIFLLVLTLLSC